MQIKLRHQQQFDGVVVFALLLSIGSISAKSLCLKLTALRKSREKVAEGFAPGDLLHVRGNVTTYSGERGIKAAHSSIGKSLLL